MERVLGTHVVIDTPSNEIMVSPIEISGVMRLVSLFVLSRITSYIL
jgi:hypothetical protein